MSVQSIREQYRSQRASGSSHHHPHPSAEILNEAKPNQAYDYKTFLLDAAASAGMPLDHDFLHGLQMLAGAPPERLNYLEGRRRWSKQNQSVR